MTYVLITRPQPEAHKLEALLSKEPKISTFCEPMLHIVPKKTHLTVESEGPTKVTDFIVTSCRVLEIIENWKDHLDIPLWCVGDVTAHEAKLKGFKTIHCADRSAQDLLEMIVKETGQQKARYHFLHVCGDTLHLDLSEALSRLGYQADKNVVYNTQPSKELSKKFIGLWTKKSIVLAPFFSQRTSEIFVDLIKKHKLQKYCTSVRALAHSEAVLRKLEELQWAGIDLVPDLGEEKIRLSYEQIGQNKASIPEPERETLAREASTKTSSVGFLWGLTGVLLTVVLTLSIGWFILLPYQIESLRASVIDQQQSHQKDLLNNLKSQLTLEFKAQLNQKFQEEKIVFQREISQLEAKIAKLENTPGGMDSHLLENIEQYQRQSLESLSQERSEDMVNLMTYQKVLTCLDHLKKSSLSSDEQDFLKTEGMTDKNGDDVLSIPQLIKGLEALDFSIYTEDTSLGGKVLSALKEVLGIKIRQKKQLSIKETILSDLKKYQFSFLDTLNTKEILLPASLEKELAPWIEKANKTRSVLDKIIQEQQKIQKRLVAKPQEKPITESTAQGTQ